MFITKQELLESGIHFGHGRKRKCAYMMPYVFGEKGGSYIIDIDKTVLKVKEAFRVIFDVVKRGGTVLFVGTKKQAKEAVKKHAEQCSMPYVSERWVAGSLTNFKVIKKSIDELKIKESMIKNGEFDKLNSKEQSKFSRRLLKLQTNFTGIKDLQKIPEITVIFDIRNDEVALKEANVARSYTIGLVDTNADPRMVSLAIPGNDDAIKGINLLVQKFCSVILDAQLLRKEEQKRNQKNEKEEKKETKTKN